jgi:hypothetical protein
MRLESMEDAEDMGLDIDTDASGVAFVGFENLEVDGWERFNYVDASDEYSFVLYVVGVDESAECSAGGDGINEGYLMTLITAGPYFLEDLDLDDDTP